MRCGRRTFLIAGGLVLAGCGTDAPTPSSGSTTSSAAAGTSSTAPASASTSAAAVPSRDEMIAKYAGQAPSEWGLEVTGVVQRAESSQVALTLDACGGPNGSGIDQELIDFLVSSQTPATLFLNSRWIEANPAATDQLIANDLFCIANHGTKHVPLSATGQSAYGITGNASIGEAYDEVMGNQELLTGLMGEPPKYFRPGTAYFDEICADMVRGLGLLPVNFDINSDGGATMSAAQVVAATSAAKPGSICIGHFNRPSGSTYEGLMQVVPQLKSAGLVFARLDEMTLA